jgi:hypothetical protein
MPSTFNMHMRIWMHTQSKNDIENLSPDLLYSDYPTKGGLACDFVNLLLVAFAYVAVIVGVTHETIPTSYSDLIRRTLHHDIQGIIMGLISAICAGCALANIRLMTNRQHTLHRNWIGGSRHNHLKIWFWTLLLLVIVAPSFMYPSVAMEERVALNKRYKFTHLIYFIVSAGLKFLAFCGLGNLLQHSYFSVTAIALTLMASTIIFSVILDVIIIP